MTHSKFGSDDRTNPDATNEPDTADYATDDFSAAMQDVAPISKGKRQLLKSKVEVTPAQLQRRDAALGLGTDLVDPNFLTLAEVKQREPLEYLEWRKDGVQKAVFDKLRRGGYAIEDSLDLHRKTVKEARSLLFNFINKCIARDLRCISVSPGKGEFSTTPARLKSYTAAWLEEHPQVIAFCSAQRHQGGVGSVYVLIKKSPQSREITRQQFGGKDEYE